MKTILILVGVVALLMFAVPAGAEDKAEAKGDAVKYDVNSGYFEKNNSGLKGDSSYLAIADQKAFDKVFGVAFVAGKKQNFLPKDAFETKIVVAAIKRGDAVYEYKVEKVAADKDVLYIQYTATAKGGAGSAKFASPLIISLDKGKYESVVFLENGKKAGTASFGK